MKKEYKYNPTTNKYECSGCGNETKSETATFKHIERKHAELRMSLYSKLGLQN